MTLNEAYELQRREVISLRAKVARLEKQVSGLFPIEEKESLERHIRHLEQLNKTEKRKREETRAHFKEMEALRFKLVSEISDLKEQLEDAKKENELLKVRAEKAEAEVAMLNGSNAKLQKRFNTNFENSSLPSSALPFRKKVPNSRKPTGRKPGAQIGHEPHSLSKLPATREPVFIPAPDEIVSNPDLYPTGKDIIRQLIDISISVNVTDYIAEEYRSRKTGTRYHAAFPNALTSSVNYGPSVKALAFLLNNYYNVPVAKTSQCISDITRGIVNISAGTICNLSSEFSAATESERNTIFSILTHADTLYSDATVSNVNGKRKTVIVCTDKEHALYQHLEHKGHEGLSKTPVKNFEGTIVHDHDKSYYSYGSSHQECLAHVLRYLVGAAEYEPNLSWHKQMHELLQNMIHTANINKSGIPRDIICSFKNQYTSILDIAAREYEEHPPSSYFPDGYNLFKRLRDYKQDHLFFLTHPEIDCTNNISERQLRKFKRKQKQAVVLRSDLGGQHICDALTIIETAKMQHQNVYDIAIAAFRK